MKKVTLCASMAFWEDILAWKEKLATDGYDVIQYPRQFSGEFLPNYEREFTEHYQKILVSDVVLVLNMEKNGIDGYIGAAVFAEIAFAVGLNRSVRAERPIDIYCLKEFSVTLPYAEELRHWVDLGWVKFWQESVDA